MARAHALRARCRRAEDGRSAARPPKGTIHHSDHGGQGGFKRSSQRSTERSCDGQAEEVEVGADGAAGDAFAGSAAGGAPGASGAVLGGDRSRRVERGWRRRRRACRRWLASGGFGRLAGCRHRSIRAPLSGRYLSFAEREEIALLRARGCGVREIARRLGRSPSTISRELRRNAATRSGRLEYRASTAQWHADRRARRPKPAKLAVNAELRRYVQERLAGAVQRPDGGALAGPDVGGSAGVTAAARTGAGRSRGARSRSPIGCGWTSRMMSRCGSRTRRSTSRSMCRAAARSGAS